MDLLFKAFNKITVLCLIFVLIMFSCKKDDEKDTGITFEFSELKAASDTIYSGSSTSITATAKGNNLTYLWSASAGTILGSGHQVNYTTPPCVPGINEISCTVKDNNDNSRTKSVEIVVL